jgi:two-component system response regulator TctD
MRLLLVEDNRALSDWLARLLRKSNYVVDCVFSGEDAEHAAASEDYDLAIVDVGLPGIDGMEVVKRVRQRGQDLPILILTAIDTVTSRVRGLDLGADDYLVKPFDIDELEARIRVQLRRRGGLRTTTIAYGDLSFDTNSRQFSLRGDFLDLTKREHAVLEALISRAGTTFAKSALVDRVFGYEDEAGPSAIEVYIHRVRKKIEIADVTIVTLRGLGYVLRKKHESPARE